MPELKYLTRHELIALCLLATITGGILFQVRDSRVVSSSYHSPRIEVLGYAWNFLTHPELLVLLIPPRALPEWRSSYLQAARDGILGWRDCIQQFVVRYGFSYLSALDFEVLTESVKASEPIDVTVTWISHFNEPTDLATTTVTSDRLDSVRKASIVVSLTGTIGSTRYVLTETDTQAITAEEFGHVLGLGHVDRSDDLMSGFDRLPLRIDSHSTRDIYAPTIVYIYLRALVFRAPSRAIISLDETDISYVVVIE